MWSAYYSPRALAAEETVGSRRRQGAAVPIGTKKMVDVIGSGMCRRENTLHIKY